MKNLKDKRAGITRYALLLLVAASVILYLGLRPKDFNALNSVERLNERAGIRFEKHGLAYAVVSDPLIQQNIAGPAVFTIEMAFKPKSYQERGFNLVFSLHSGNDKEQLIVGQWQSSIIIMNGDDYNYKQRIPRAVIKADTPDSKQLFLTIVKGKDETRVYADGVRIKTLAGFRLAYPKGKPLLLTLGNSVYGNHSWTGEFYGFALYGDALNAQRIENHFHLWSTKNDFSFAKNENPSMLYFFDERGDSKVIDHGKAKHDLLVPQRMKALKRQLLMWPSKGFMLTGGFISDVLINLVGFIPLGFVLCALLMGHGKATDKQSIVATVMVCFVLSIVIEIVQSWIPSRNSSMLDLILNTGGGFLGAMGAKARKLVGWEDKKLIADRAKHMEGLKPGKHANGMK